jgi:tetratricopeptide (TPR) repeat protein
MTSDPYLMSAPSLLAKANDQIRQDQVAAGLETLKGLTARYPRYAEGWFVRSSIESRTGAGLSAIESARAALDAERHRMLYRANLAQMQVNYGEWGDALHTLAPALQTGPGNFDARLANSVGSSLSITGNELQAQAWFEHAATHAPGNANYAYNRAQGLLYCGRMDEARSAFSGLVREFPDFAKAHWSLATFDSRGATEARLQTLQKAIRRAGSAVDEVMYCYALFSTLDALGRTDDAFAELSHGMRLQRARIRYAGQDADGLMRLIQLGCRWLDATSRSAIAADEGSQPIFIVGLPRSGTTVVERILGNHPDVAQGGEMTAFSAAMRRQMHAETVNPMMTAVPAGYFESPCSPELLRSHYLRQTAVKLGGKKFLTDKYPFNFMLVPWIAAAFPRAPILHLRRDAMDVCFGNLKQLFSGAYGACYSQEDIADYHRAYTRMMACWHERLPGRILEVKYEALVQDPERGAAELLEFCGLEPVADVWRIERNKRAVTTASTAQVRDAINTRGIGSWRRYEAHLQPLLHRLHAV